MKAPKYCCEVSNQRIVAIGVNHNLSKIVNFDMLVIVSGDDQGLLHEIRNNGYGREGRADNSQKSCAIRRMNWILFNNFGRRCWKL